MSIKSQIIRLRNLLCFMATAKDGTVSGAALKNGMKQSNLSNAIKTLEDEMHIKLFDRVHNGMSLTENGKEVYRIACEIDNTLFKIKNFSTAVRQISGDIRLWTSDGLGSGYLSGCLSDFHVQYPDVHIDVICSIDSPRVMHEADMAIVYDQPQQDGAVILAKNDLKFGLFASMEYLSKYGYPKSIEDLQQNHNICNRDNFTSVWDEWKQFIAKCKHVVVTTNSSGMMTRLTRDGIGIGLHPVGVAAKEKELVHLSKIDMHLSHPFWIIAKPETKDVPKVRALIDYIKNATEKL